MKTEKKTKDIKDALWRLYDMAEFAIAISDGHKAKVSQVIDGIECIFKNVEKDKGELK